jgi:integrase
METDNRDAEIIGPVETTGADLVPVPAPHAKPLPASVVPLGHVREYIRASKAEATLRAYSADWRDFCAWAEGHGLSPMPVAPEAIAAYIADCADRLKVGSVQRRLNAIAEAHKAAGLESPTHSAIVANTMKGIRRTRGTAPTQKAAALTADIRAMVDAADGGLIGLRDRALVLLGFAGAFRRSELVALDAADCTFSRDGLTDVAAVENGSGGGGPESGHPVWRESRDVPGPHHAILDRAGGHRRRAGVPVHQSARTRSAGPVERDRRGARGKEAGATGGA